MSAAVRDVTERLESLGQLAGGIGTIRTVLLPVTEQTASARVPVPPPAGPQRVLRPGVHLIEKPFSEATLLTKLHEILTTDR